MSADDRKSEDLSLKEIQEKIVRISGIYTKNFNITPTDDWYLLKIQEEIGELTSAHLKRKGQARAKEASDETLEKNKRDELADVLAHTLLYAHSQNIDLIQALEDKWLHYLKK